MLVTSAAQHACCNIRGPCQAHLPGSVFEVELQDLQLLQPLLVRRVAGSKRQPLQVDLHGVASISQGMRGKGPALDQDRRPLSTAI